jgi:uncharacterized membrane protein YkoI
MKSWKAGTVAAMAIVGGFATTVFAKDREIKESEVPAAVMKAVNTRYPNAKPSKFATETEKGKPVYEVKLDVGGKSTEVSVAPDGTVVSEEQVIDVGELPDSVKSSFSASSYAKAKILRVEKELKGGTTRYEVLVEDQSKKSEVVFDAGGKLVKHEEKKAGGKEADEED